MFYEANDHPRYAIHPERCQSNPVHPRISLTFAPRQIFLSTQRLAHHGLLTVEFTVYNDEYHRFFSGLLKIPLLSGQHFVRFDVLGGRFAYHFFR